MSIDANNTVTLDAAGASQGTHLSTSLKDLQKLGVDAVSVAGGVSDVLLDLGSVDGGFQIQAGALPTFSSETGSALNVTLQTSDVGMFADLAALDTRVLSGIGIDTVKLDLAGGGDLDTLLGTANFASDFGTLQTELSALRADGLQSVLQIDQLQAHQLIDASLSFAQGPDGSVLDASAAAQGTHLSTSLKDLQKLGVDAVSVAGSGIGEISLDLGGSLGGTDGFSLSGGMPLFGDTNADGVLSLAEDSALKVTLDVADMSQLQQVANFGTATDTTLLDQGIDAVRLDLVGDGIFDGNYLNALDQQLAAVQAHGLQSIANIDVTQAQHLIGAGLNFATNDTIMLDASAGGHGTHLSTSLKDLQKLGVDAVSFDQSVQSVQVNFGADATALAATHVPSFSGALDVTLNVNEAQFADVGKLQSTLAKAGVDHLGIFSSDLSDNNNADLSTLFGKLDSGLDITLKVDNTQNWTTVDGFVNQGVDLLGGKVLNNQATWGDLIQTLHESGLGNVQIQENTHVTISDEMSSALYDAGMLHALPDASIAIESSTRVLTTSLKAMAELGVDAVTTTAQDTIYVGLGIKAEDLQTVADLGDIFTAFGLDKPDTSDHTDLFANGQQAGLVLDQSSFKALGEAGVQELVGQLGKLGFTELDVLGPDNTFMAYDITAQAPVLTPVQVMGTTADADMLALFDPHHLSNKVVK